MKELFRQAMDQARTQESLRGMSPNIRRHFSAIERRMHKRQRAWGGNLSVLNDETKGRSAAIRRSLAFERIMREMPIGIEDGDIIVGNCVGDDTIIRCSLPIFLRNDELGRCSISMSHKCPDYEGLLRKGLRAVHRELEAQKPAARQEPFEDERRKKLDFIEAAQREIEGLIALSNRYADLAEQQADICAEAGRREELREIARVCRRVPEHPAGSLHEALQSVWIYNHSLLVSLTSISIGNIDRILAPYFEADWEDGRITLDRAQELVDSFCLRVNDRAQLDLENYYVEDITKVEGISQQSRSGVFQGFVTSYTDQDHIDAINHWGQNILISGRLPGGKDATCALTYLFLNAHEKFSMTSPVLTVRMHKNTPPELYDRVAEVLKSGGGMPYINNDDVLVQSYMDMGVPEEDACWYANSNCWETLLQGSSNQEMIKDFNFLYYLEMALNRGESFLGHRIREPKIDRANPMNCPGSVYPLSSILQSLDSGIDTGDIGRFTTFEDLMQAWRTQLDFSVKTSIRGVVHGIRRMGTQGELTHIPILSALTKDCVANIADVAQGGARYTQWHLLCEAVSNAADALAAIRKFVYEDGELTLRELVEVLKSNWAGKEGEFLRQRFVKEAPKFGNNIDSVDNIAAQMIDYFVERCQKYAADYPDILFSPCIGTFSWIITIGKRIGASADGRMSRENIASNMSPVPGHDVSGPTSAINSYLKLNTKAMPAGAPLDLRLSKNGLEGPEGTRRIAGLIKTLLQEGGNMMTLTITSAEELRRAIANPEQYRGLRVRMGGWSAYFVLLSEEAQKIQLARVEHGLA